MFTLHTVLISFHGQLIYWGRDDEWFYLSDCSQTKTGIYLMQEGNEEPFNIRLHLAKDILTIQEQDVICVSGEPFYSSVSNSVRQRNTEISNAHGKINEIYSTIILWTGCMLISVKSSVNLFLINQMRLAIHLPAHSV